ncbi:MAG: pyridoxal phosphate-dependent aminotransferase, partial [Cyclobacteriaceae bacterium]
MRQRLLRAGADELSYEIRGIVRKAEQLQELGYEILWENIGDPIQKHQRLPQWMKTILTDLLNEDDTYSYSHSKGVLATRAFLADRTNRMNGVQIKPEDITFFNGLGDAIAKMYQYLLPTSRVIGPSPAYSTHSSAEAAHANHHPITYKLDPKNSWYPDMEDLYNKVKYNPSIVGMLIINPDNPTGMVYPREILEEMVNIAREFDLFIISDEIYQHIVYNGATATALAEIIGDLPGIALKGISKEIPWPGARCGWAEYYNRKHDSEFDRLCQTLDNAKMIEVSSTKLPQVAIPKLLGHEKYPSFRLELNERIGKRSQLITDILGNLPHIEFNPTNGAFYNTIIFKAGVLKPGQTMKINDQRVSALLETWLNEPTVALDKRFVYYLLAAKNVCVVPISSFCSDLLGFRVTLLEEDEQMLQETFKRIREGILE